MGNKRKKREDDYEYDPAPKHLQIGHIKNQEKRLIVILENAQLESVKVRLYFLMSIIVYKFNHIFLIVINYFFVFILIFCIYKHNLKHRLA